MSLLRSVALVLTLALSPLSLFAQNRTGISTFGRDFFGTVFQSRAACDFEKRFIGSYAIVCAPYATQVSISYFDAISGREIQGPTYLVAAQLSKQIPLDPSYMGLSYEPGDQAEYRAVHLHADRPVTVYLYTKGPTNQTMTRLLPVSLLDKHYIIASLPSNDGSGATTLCTAVTASSLFAVVAIADSTRVTIIPNGTTLTNKVGLSTGTYSDGVAHPYTVSLNRGEVYYVKSERNDNETDEAGSTVDASKPVAVFAGHESALNGLSSSATHGLEQRNMLFQQLLPTLYWRTRGYLSIPLYDSPGGPSGDNLAGDRLRVFTSTDDNQLSLRLGSGVAMTPTINTYHFLDRDNIVDAANISSNSGQPIMPVLFDYRQQNTSEPYPAPTMMVMSAWDNRTHTQMFMAPKDNGTSDQFVILTVIGSNYSFGRIRAWINGSIHALTDLPSVGTQYSIPASSGLYGRRFQITAGSTYSLTGDSDFVAYLNGYEGMSPSANLTGRGEDNSYTEFATPLNGVFWTDSIARPTVTVTPMCSSWNINAHISDTLGIADIQVLNDPMGIEVLRPNDSGYTSTNISSSSYFRSALDFVPGDTSASALIQVANPRKAAEAYVRIVGRSGYDTIIHLTYRPKRYSFSEDSLAFRNIMVDQRVCKSIFFRNAGTVSGDTLRVFALVHNADTSFDVSTTSTLPALLALGDSLPITICFHSARAPHFHFDTLRVQLGCTEALIPMHGTTVFPSLFAYDMDFGSVPVSESRTGAVQLRNVGQAPLTVSGLRESGGSKAFIFLDSARFPILLDSGLSTTVQFRYAPETKGKDSASFEWISDSQFADKTTTMLYGLGMKPELAWSAQTYHFGTWNLQTDTLWLTNPGDLVTGEEVYVDSVVISGLNANDFSLGSNAIGYYPLSSFAMQPRDSIWTEVSFHPDTSVTHSTRFARATAVTRQGILATAELVGTIGLAGVRVEPTLRSVRFTDGRQVELVQCAEPASLEVLDILGRVVIPSTEVTGRYSVPMSAFPAGSYIIRVEAHGRSVIHEFQITQ